jgi:hypothetical protein
VWKVIDALTPSIPIQRQVLDGYHLLENLHQVGGSLKRLAMVENYLWQGWLEPAIAAIEGLKNQQARNFQQYRQKHRHRIPCYQQLGRPISSGDVEAKIKRERG